MFIILNVYLYMYRMANFQSKNSFGVKFWLPFDIIRHITGFGTYFHIILKTTPSSTGMLLSEDSCHTNFAVL